MCRRAHRWKKHDLETYIRINIKSQDVFTHPSESYLIFEGRLTNAAGTAYANADEAALTNNAIMHLFSRIEYHLSNQLIESLSYSGRATTMLGMLKYPDKFSKAQGLNQLWYKYTSTTAAKADNNGFAARHAHLIQSLTVKGIFRFIIQLKHIFGFCEDYNKIVYGLKRSLTLVMKTGDDAIFRGATAGAGKVSLDKFHGSCPTLFRLMPKSFPFTRLLNQKLSYR